MMHAVHAAAAPLVAESGGRIFEKFADAMMRIIRPVAPTSMFEKLKAIALRQKAEREAVDREAA